MAPAAGGHRDRDHAHRAHRRPDAERRAAGRAARGHRTDDGRHARRSRSSAWLVLGGLVAWPWLPIAPDAVGLAAARHAAVLVVMVVSFSPTMTAAVITDTGARGRLSDTVLAMVVLADLVLLVLFSVSMQLARVVFDTGGAESVDVLARLAWEIGGAVAFGVLVGALFALYLRYVGREVTLVLLAVCARAQPGRLDAAVRAAPGRGGGGPRDREPGGGAGRRAARRRAARRAARAGGLLRGRRRVAAARCARRDRRRRRRAVVPSGSGSSGWASAPGVYVSGFPTARRQRMRGPGWSRRPASRWASPRSSRASFPGGAARCSCCWWRRSRSTSSVGPILFRRGLAQAGELDAHDAAAADGGVEPRAVPAQPGGRRHGHGERRRPAASPWRSTR